MVLLYVLEGPEVMGGCCDTNWSSSNKVTVVSGVAGFAVSDLWCADSEFPLMGENRRRFSTSSDSLPTAKN